jgi:alpha-L-glutamate ligase-like protein
MSSQKRHHSFWSQLRFIRQVVLGLNRRNSHYIFDLNAPALLPLVDEKLLTKARMIEHNIPTPATYGVMHSRAELRHLEGMLHDASAFVCKPGRGSGGGGILIVKREASRWVAPDGATISLGTLRYHCEEILSGVYSLDERADVAFFEHCVVADPNLPPSVVPGIPDIRFLVVRGIPILAMLRLPSVRSGGRANLHVGGIGCGVDLRTGITQRGVYRNYLVRRHPDTHVPLGGFQMPYWPELLLIAARSYDAVPLGYLGVDIVIDAAQGPLVLELNARPGLQIQLANRVGLRPLLERTLAHPAEGKTPEVRVALGQEIYSDVARTFFDD